jgi:hypothetical protein
MPPGANSPTPIRNPAGRLSCHLTPEVLFALVCPVDPSYPKRERIKRVEDFAPLGLVFLFFDTSPPPLLLSPEILLFITRPPKPLEGSLLHLQPILFLSPEHVGRKERGRPYPGCRL